MQFFIGEQMHVRQLVTDGSNENGRAAQLEFIYCDYKPVLVLRKFRYYRVVQIGPFQ